MIQPPHELPEWLQQEAEIVTRARRKARLWEIAFVGVCVVMFGLGLLLAANAVATMALRADCPCTDVDLVQ